MRDTISEELERFRIKGLENDPKLTMTEYIMNNSGSTGVFLIISNNNKFFVCSTASQGWDHVSVSKQTKGRKKKLPTWDEMCMIKEMFFDPEELVVQYHPKKSEYVNFHPGVLHLWRKQGEEIPRPPKNLV